MPKLDRPLAKCAARNEARVCASAKTRYNQARTVQRMSTFTATEISVDQPIAEILARYPSAISVFRRMGLAGCLGCVMAPYDSLSDAVGYYHLDLARILQALRDAASEAHVDER